MKVRVWRDGSAWRIGGDDQRHPQGKMVRLLVDLNSCALMHLSASLISCDTFPRMKTLRTKTRCIVCTDMMYHFLVSKTRTAWKDKTKQWQREDLSMGDGWGWYIPQISPSSHTDLFLRPVI